MEHHSDYEPGSHKPLLVVIFLVLALYGGLAVMGLPQQATAMIAAEEAAKHNGQHAEHAEPAHDVADAEHAPAGEPAKPMPAYWIVIPFVLLLGAIAVFPLMDATMHWWESNLHRFYVAAGLGLLTLLYYLLIYQQPIDRHFLSHAVIDPGEGWFSWGVAGTILQNAILNEYIPFIMLLFSLFTITGGIRISGDLPAHPSTNTIFIGIGGLLASFIGTTGAAMLLIRPLLETNRERKRVQHTVIFFIFVVCNCGGCLLPIGDPPLFLGYLQGVDFLWTFKLWKEWLFVNGVLLVVYYAWDHFICYKHEAVFDLVRDETRIRPLKFSGLWPNVLLLMGVVLSVALLDPKKVVPGTDFRPWIYLREIVQLLLVGLSLVFGSDHVRKANRFTFTAIVEVAALFLGIFICMQPALQILAVHGGDLGINSTHKFFWATGTLSSVLDNAPTYMVFFETALSVPSEGVPKMAGVAEHFLIAISLGAVFMGSMTYIGNGPNFMVKTIAESSRVRMPSFFGYMIYSCSILLPILVVMTYLFL